MTAAPIIAAGAICWRMVDGRPRVLLVHRAERADVSFPKGKLDAGETLPEAAVREVHEETGLLVTLGAPLGTVEYRLPGGREKVVHYWSAEIDEHALELARFTPNAEIASLEWIAIDKARRKLSYEHDRDVVDRFAERLTAGRARTFAIIAVRHGKAVPPETWDGPDSTRPLMHRGIAEAEGIARGIAAFSPGKIMSSTAVRCLATVEPLSLLTGLPVSAKDALSQDAFEAGKSNVPATVGKRIMKRHSVVLCSHGPVLPRIVAAVAELTETGADASLKRASELGTGDFAVMHISHENPLGGLVAVEIHSPVRPAEFGSS